MSKDSEKYDPFKKEGELWMPKEKRGHIRSSEEVEEARKSIPEEKKIESEEEKEKKRKKAEEKAEEEKELKKKYGTRWLERIREIEEKEQIEEKAEEEKKYQEWQESVGASDAQKLAKAYEEYKAAEAEKKIKEEPERVPEDEGGVGESSTSETSGQATQDEKGAEETAEATTEQATQDEKGAEETVEATTEQATQDERTSEETTEETPGRAPEQEIRGEAETEAELEEVFRRYQESKPSGEGLSEAEKYNLTRNFYLDKLGYETEYRGLLRGKARLKIKGAEKEYVLDERDKPVEFKAKFSPKGETPLLKFLREKYEAGRGERAAGETSESASEDERGAEGQASERTSEGTEPAEPTTPEGEEAREIQENTNESIDEFLKFLDDHPKEALAIFRVAIAEKIEKSTVDFSARLDGLIAKIAQKATYVDRIGYGAGVVKALWSIGDRLKWIKGRQRIKELAPPKSYILNYRAHETPEEAQREAESVALAWKTSTEPEDIGAEMDECKAAIIKREEDLKRLRGFLSGPRDRLAEWIKINKEKAEEKKKEIDRKGLEKKKSRLERRMREEAEK